MSLTQGELPGETEAGDDAEISGVFGAELVVELGSLDAITDSATLISETESFMARVPQLAAGVTGEQLDNLIGGLLDAEGYGEVLPGQTRSAVAFVLKIAGVAALAGTSTAAAELSSAFSNYAVQAGNPGNTAGLSQVQGVAGGRPQSNVVTVPQGTATVQGPTGAISVAVNVPDPTSPGGKLVAAAEKTLKRTSVRVPGFTAPEARAVSLALAQAYQNFLAVQVDVTNDLEGSLTDIRTEIKTLTSEVNAGTTTSSTAVTSLQHDVSLIDTRIANLISGQSALETQLKDLQKQVTRTEAPAPVTSTPPVPVTGVEFTAADAALVATIPALATTASVQVVQNELDNLPAPPPETQTSPTQVIPTSPPMTLQDLVDCCEANDEITGPIRSGGATPGLLSGLGALLGIAGLLTTAATIITTVLGILDLDDTVAGVDWSAEHVATIVDRVVPIVTSEVSWSDNLALGAN